jgi:uncharacterized protein YbaP (TraB family)
MLKYILSSALLLPAFALSACNAPVGPGESVQDRVAEARARNDGPAIWKVSDADSTLYLFGSLHLLPDDVTWLRDDLRDVMRGVGTVFFEVDTSEEASSDATLISAELGLRQDGRLLADSLDNYQLKLLEAVSHNGQIPLASLDAMKPWLASEYLTSIAAEQAGLSWNLSADEALKSMARRQQKNILYLETSEDQIRAVADLPEVVQLDILTETMEEFDDIGAQLKRLAAGWAVGQKDFLKQQMIDPLRQDAGEMYRSLLVDRNRKWSKILLPHLEGSGESLIVVGTAHLLGEESLLTFLEEAGYEVERHYAFMGENVISPTDLVIERPKRED